MQKRNQNFQTNYSLLIVFLLLPIFGYTQFLFEKNNLPEAVTLYKYAQIADAGQQDFSIEQIINQKSSLNFKSITGENTNLGFTNNNYWIKFSLKNNTNSEIRYFLETARPVTDLVNLYKIDENNTIELLKSGDNLPFNERSFKFRKPIFKITLLPNQTLAYFLHLKSDGEVINMPILLRSENNLIQTISLEQIIFGIFYGILLITALIYFFIFFGLREKSFLYYSSYVVFVGFLQFSLDGYFHQYIITESNWFANHSVIIFAIFSTFFLGKYVQEFLRISKYCKFINNSFNVLYCFLGLFLIIVILFPSAIIISYPLANIFGLIVLILIISSVITLLIQKIAVDGFFLTGVICLISGFIIFILNNFSVVPNSFFTENSSKFGTGFEVIFLSLSMANFIRNIKNEREELNKLALIRAEELSELKSYFLSNISHELRTPLNAIMNLIDSISKEAVDEKIKKNCEIIKYSSQSLLSSINDILDFSKIQKQELKLESCEFEPFLLFEIIKENALIRAKDQGLDFQFSLDNNLPDVFIGDEMRLMQIINNVISNALKFTFEGFIKLSITSQIKADETVTLNITISDSGVGIPKEKISSIFDSFTQDSINNKRKFGGLGLGLYIVKVLVDLHHGSINLESKVNQGTVCSISLNYTVAKTKKQIVAIENPIFDLKGKNILVVEDNAINQIVIKMITKKWLNTNVVYTNNGQECLDAIKANQFDIVLMDLQMPVMDGYQATIAIRNGEVGIHNKKIPIIAVTADVMETTKSRVIEIGMNKYLSKPLKNESLFEAIRALA